MFQKFDLMIKAFHAFSRLILHSFLKQFLSRTLIFGQINIFQLHNAPERKYTRNGVGGRQMSHALTTNTRPEYSELIAIRKLLSFKFKKLEFGFFQHPAVVARILECRQWSITTITTRNLYLWHRTSRIWLTKFEFVPISIMSLVNWSHHVFVFLL